MVNFVFFDSLQNTMIYSYQSMFLSLLRACLRVNMENDIIMLLCAAHVLQYILCYLSSLMFANTISTWAFPTVFLKLNVKHRHNWFLPFYYVPHDGLVMPRSTAIIKSDIINVWRSFRLGIFHWFGTKKLIFIE